MLLKTQGRIWHAIQLNWIILTIPLTWRRGELWHPCNPPCSWLKNVSTLGMFPMGYRIHPHRTSFYNLPGQFACKTRVLPPWVLCNAMGRAAIFTVTQGLRKLLLPRLPKCVRYSSPREEGNRFKRNCLLGLATKKMEVKQLTAIRDDKRAAMLDSPFKCPWFTPSATLPLVVSTY